MIQESATLAEDAATGRAGTLQRGLAILSTLTIASRQLTLAEVAAAAGLDQSTTLRLLRVLEDEQYVLRDPASRRYAPSPRLLHPLPLLHPLEQMRRETRSILTNLSAELGTTVILVLFRGIERMVLDIALVPQAVAPYYDTWLKGPLHATGVGKACLAGMGEADAAKLLGPGPLQRFTPATIVDPADLMAELARSQERGYITSRGEYRPGITNVAHVLRSWNGAVVGCINITAREPQMDDDMCQRCGEALRRASDELIYQTPSLESVSNYLHA